jgi:hypothetical protein
MYNLKLKENAYRWRESHRDEFNEYMRLKNKEYYDKKSQYWKDRYIRKKQEKMDLEKLSLEKN